MTINPLDIINEFYEPGTDIHTMLVEHNRLVTERALAVADKVAHLDPDREFIREAAMLHDIAIFRTSVPDLCCEGDYPYLCHGYLGRELLEARGLHRHALVCERHVGTGITAEDIRQYNLPLPVRDMVPLTLEEQIIAYADKFYSKDCVTVFREKNTAQVAASLEKHGAEKVKTFLQWAQRFEGYTV